MSASRVPEVLYDSETMLRLLDRELEELRDGAPRTSIGGLASVLQRANVEIGHVLRTLHDSQQALHDASLKQIHDSTAKLREVSSATEVAATTIMDGLDRAHALVDELEALDRAAPAEAGAVRDRLRDELYAMVAPLQFQDITTQQLEHVSGMLADVERRLLAIAALLDGSWTEAARMAAASAEAAPDVTFSESASVNDAARRQAEADALFWAGAKRGGESR